MDPLTERLKHVIRVRYAGSIADATRAAKLTQNHLTKHFAIAKKREESGGKPPTITIPTLRKMAEGWNVSLDYLAYGKGPGPEETTVELDDRYHGRGEAIPMLRRMGVSERTIAWLRTKEKQDYEGQPAIWWVRRGLEEEARRADPFYTEGASAELDPDL